MSFSPLTAGQTRVFLIEGRARPDHAHSYESTMRLTSLSQSFGDITKIEVPDPLKYGSYIEVGEIRGSQERATVSLEGRYALDLKSDLLRLAKQGCKIDLQLHMGQCQDPSAFDDFSKALILEGVDITAYNTDDLGALASGDEALINESVDLSVKNVYEVLPLTFARRADNIITNEVVDIVVVGNVSCGECDESSDGCKLIVAVTIAAGGSPGTSPDIVYSNDNGATWVAHDIDTLTSAQDASAVASIGSYIVVSSNGAGSLNYALLSELRSTGTDPAFTEITTGIAAGGEPNDMSVASGVLFAVGDAGYIYSTTDVTAGLTVLDAGAALTDNLLAVHALSDTFAVAVGNAGAIVKTEDGSAWTAVTPSPVGVTINFTSVWVKNEKEWFLGTSNGKLYYTADGGTTFSEKTFSGSGAGQVDAIAMSSDSVLYIAHRTATPNGRILRSYNSGYSFVVLPEGSASLQSVDYFNALATCWHDPNVVYAAGLDDDAADGVILRGAG